MRRSYPATPIPPEHQDQRGSFTAGLSAGRHQDDVHYTREWFLSDAAFAAYLAGFEIGKRQRTDLEERNAVDTVS